MYWWCGLRYGHIPKKGVLRDGTTLKKGVLGTGTARKKGGIENWSCIKV